MTSNETKTLNEKWSRAREILNEVASALQLRFRSDLVMLFSPTLSRNPHLDPIYHRVVRRLFLFGEEDQSPVSLPVGRSFLTSSYLMRQVVAGLVRWARDFVVDVRFHYTLRRLCRKAPVDDRSGEVVIIDTFVIPSMVNGKAYSDRYYGELRSFRPSESSVRTIFVPTFVGFKAFDSLTSAVRKMGQRGPVLLKQSFLSWTSFISNRLRSLSIAFRLPSLARFLRDQGYPEWLRREVVCSCRESIGSAQIYTALDNYCFIKKARVSGSWRRFILWYENQPCDKGYCLALNRFAPWISQIGYLGSQISFRHNPYLAPTRVEESLHVTPETIGVIGKASIGPIREHCPSKPVEIVPAFRFRLSSDLELSDGPMGHDILILLPFDGSDAVSLVSSIMKAIEGEAYKRDVRIKPHPANDVQWISGKLEEDGVVVPPVVSGPLNAALRTSKLVLGSWTTGLFESVMLGVPAVVFVPEGHILQSPIPETVPQSLWRLVYSPSELREAIRSFLGTTGGSRDGVMRSRLRDEFFSPVTKMGVERLLGTSVREDAL